MTQETKILLIIGLVTLVVTILGVFLLNKSSTGSPNSGPVDQNILIREDSYQTASASAKVTVVEFGDFQCPACAASYPVVEEIIKTYPDKVNFVFRHFPLTIHKNAVVASQAVEAAGEQGKFWEMQAILYKNQTDWGESNNPREYFEKYAKELGLQVDQFKQVLDQEKYKDKILRDYADGVSLGVNSTPSFFINGVKINLVSYDQLKQQVEKNLNSN